MKKSELFFSALQVPVDFIAIVLAGLVAYFIRVAPSVQGLRPVLYEFGLRQYSEMLLIVGALFVLVYAIDGMYRIKATRSLLGTVYRVFRATTIAAMILIIAIFLNRDWFSSRFIILAGGILAFLFVTIGRVALGFLQKYLLISKGIGIHRLLIVGVNGFCSTVKKEIKKDRYMGYRIVGHIEEVDLERIERIKKMKGIDEVIQCTPEIAKTKLLKLKEYCIRNKISFRYVPTLLQTSNFDVQIFLGEPLIEIKNTPLDGWGKILKRAFDLLGGTVAIIVFSPIMIAAAIAIWIESGRPIIFLNKRVGHKGLLDVYKFRYIKKKYCHGKQFSAAHNKEALEYLNQLIKKQSIKKGPLYKIKDDPRRTKVGAFLEKLSIDELPQFFNVVKGEMSLVGPRPHQPIEVEKYDDHEKRVLTIKPGITGMSQVSGRSDLKFEDEIRLDTFYIENWSLWGDVKIILKTIPALLRRRRN